MKRVCVCVLFSLITTVSWALSAQPADSEKEKKRHYFGALYNFTFTNPSNYNALLTYINDDFGTISKNTHEGGLVYFYDTDFSVKFSGILTYTRKAASSSNTMFGFSSTLDLITAQFQARHLLQFWKFPLWPYFAFAGGINFLLGDLKVIQTEGTRGFRFFSNNLVGTGSIGILFNHENTFILDISAGYKFAKSPNMKTMSIYGDGLGMRSGVNVNGENGDAVIVDLSGISVFITLLYAFF